MDVRNQQGIRLFIVLLICTVFIYSFSHFGALAYNAMTTDSDHFSEGTAVGTVDLTGKTKVEGLTALTEQLQKWRTETTIQLHYKEKTIPLDLGIYQFELENTIEAVQNGKKIVIIATIKPDDLQSLLRQLSQDLTLEKTDLQKLNDSLLSYAHQLTSGNHIVQVEVTTKAETINQVEMKLDNVNVVMIDWIAELSPIEITPQAQISILKVIEDRMITSMPDSIKSMIATGIYETILPTNFSIIERHTSQALPNYAKLGYEANVDVKNNRDFIFANPNLSSFQLEFEWNDNTLFIKLNGSKFLYDYKVKQSEPQFFKPKTIIQYNPLLTEGKKIQQEGKDGILIKISRDVYGDRGEFIRKETISEDFYPPIHRIEIQGLPSTQPSGETGATTGSSETQQITEGTTSENTTTTAPTTETDEDLWGKPNETKK